MQQVVHTACPLDCPDTCSLEVTVDAGRIVKIDADARPSANPFTQGFICQKVKHQAQRVYAPERILAPLIRDGAAGTFREATWDEAIALIATKVRTAIDHHGEHSVVPYLYSSSAGAIERSGLTNVLFSRLGCPEVAHTICASTVDAAWKQVFGSMLSADPFDVDHAELIVVWGANPTASNTHLLPLITAASKRGAAVVVIDPRTTGMARRADLHLAIRPGTDVVLAYALTSWLVARGHHAADFLAAHTTGADAFVEAAQEWTIERAATVCGVPAAQIEHLAELIASRSPALLRLGLGLERNRNGGSGCVAAQGLWLVAGHFGRRGSGIIGSTSGAAPIDRAPLWPVGTMPVQRRQLSMNDVGETLHGPFAGSPATRVLFVQGANPVATAMDQQRWIEGLARDEVFTVVHDQVMTDTAALADVVLPATTHFEIADVASSYGSYTLQEVAPVIARVGASRSNNEVGAALAVALGMPSGEFPADHGALLRSVRADGGVGSVAKLRALGTTIQFVDTLPDFGAGPTRACLHDPASELPLPRYVADDDSRLVLLTPATNRTINSMFAEFDPPAAVLSIHPNDAARHSVSEGDTVRIFNELGEVGLLAHIDSGICEGVVSAPKGLWRRHFSANLTLNALIPRKINDLGGGACFNGARVEIEGIS